MRVGVVYLIWSTGNGVIRATLSGLCFVQVGRGLGWRAKTLGQRGLRKTDLASQLEILRPFQESLQ